MDEFDSVQPAPKHPSPHTTGGRAAERRGDGQHYVGHDRRSAPPSVLPSDVGILGVVLALVVALWAAVAALHISGHHLRLPGIDDPALTQLLHTGVAVLGAVIAFLALMRWRLIGEATALWIGVGALFFGTVAIGFGHLLPLLAVDAQALRVLRPAALATAILLLLTAAIAPTIDTRLTPRRLGFGAVILTILLAGLLLHFDRLFELVEGREGHTAIAIAWSVVAAGHVGAGRRRRSRTHLATATAAAILALGELTRILMLETAGTPGAPPALFEVVAFTLLIAQGFRDFERAFCGQRTQLLDTEVTVKTHEARRRAEHENLEERAHDAKNALLAIEGAAVTLERYRDRLAPAQREELTAAVTAEIARLQRLIAARPDPEGVIVFSVADLVGPIVATERARGMQVTVDLAPDLNAVGRPSDTVEVLRNLVDNARRYAAGSPVAVRGEVDGTWAVVYVEDRGRGVDRSERQTIFERGRRGRAASGTEGSGLGLFVARRLMLEQHGDLWVETRTGGGAAFGLCLPVSSTPTSSDAPTRVETPTEHAIAEPSPSLQGGRT